MARGITLYMPSALVDELDSVAEAEERCVFVYDNGVVGSPGYVYCQKCEGRFRPDEPLMRRLDPEAIFSTAKFNELMADCSINGAEILS